jgi:hypothetical protein
MDLPAAFAAASRSPSVGAPSTTGALTVSSSWRHEAGRRLMGSRRPQALVRIREQLPVRSFVLAIWSSCRGSCRSAASELAVAPSTTPGSQSSNAWPARPRQVWQRHTLSSTGLRALRRVPSRVAVCAYLPAPCSSEATDVVFPIKTGADFAIGITRAARGELAGDRSRLGPELE